MIARGSFKRMEIVYNPMSNLFLLTNVPVNNQPYKYTGILMTHSISVSTMWVRGSA